jgi:hypothetical protein
MDKLCKWKVKWYLEHPSGSGIGELEINATSEEQALAEAWNIVFGNITIDEATKIEGC